jgi:hypothetical protein
MSKPFRELLIILASKITAMMNIKTAELIPNINIQKGIVDKGI